MEEAVGRWGRTEGGAGGGYKGREPETGKGREGCNTRSDVGAAAGEESSTRHVGPGRRGEKADLRVSLECRKSFYL